jgi:hypothetical protein
MKLPRSFDQFLRDHVNLNQHRVDQANGAFDTLTSFLKNHGELGVLFRGTSKQGSLRQGTIIKPRKGKTEFDVDLLFLMKVVDGWSPTDYLDAVHDAFKSSDRYKDLVDRRGKHRCVTIDYAGDFHVDVVPSIERDGEQWIMNRETDEYEATDGDGYAQWFTAKNKIAGGQLARVVRLMKYLRDEHDWPVKSILLTTLLGSQVVGTDGALQYADVPTALRVLASRLDAWLQVQRTVPDVVNPALPEEEFTRHWDEATFRTFKEGFHHAAITIAAGFDEPDLERSLELWRAAFGEDFPLDDEDVEGEKVALKTQPVLGSTAHARPVTDIATSERLVFTVRLDGWVYDLKGKTRFRGINSNANVASGRAIKFKAWTNAPEPYDVRWQVVNTGAHAQRENGLRGEFFTGRDLVHKPTPKLQNWEVTRYTGRHWIECFIVKNGVCVGRSGRFYVNIKNPSF